MSCVHAGKCFLVWPARRPHVLSAFSRNFFLGFCPLCVSGGRTAIPSRPVFPPQVPGRVPVFPLYGVAPSPNSADRKEIDFLRFRVPQLVGTGQLETAFVRRMISLPNPIPPPVPERSQGQRSGTSKFWLKVFAFPGSRGLQGADDQFSDHFLFFDTSSHRFFQR